MSETGKPRIDPAASEGERGIDVPRQPKPLTREEIATIEEFEELEDLMEEPTSGDLSIISDEDVPGAPG
jgi:hypothetical protein